METISFIIKLWPLWILLGLLFVCFYGAHRINKPSVSDETWGGSGSGTDSWGGGGGSD